MRRTDGYTWRSRCTPCFVWAGCPRLCKRSVRCRRAASSTDPGATLGRTPQRWRWPRLPPGPRRPVANTGIPRRTGPLAGLTPATTCPVVPVAQPWKRACPPSDRGRPPGVSSTKTLTFHHCQLDGAPGGVIMLGNCNHFGLHRPEDPGLIALVPSRADTNRHLYVHPRQPVTCRWRCPRPSYAAEDIYENGAHACVRGKTSGPPSPRHWHRADVQELAGRHRPGSDVACAHGQPARCDYATKPSKPTVLKTCWRARRSRSSSSVSRVLLPFRMRKRRCRPG